MTKTKKKRSAKANPAKGFLKQLMRPYKKNLNVALMLALVSVGIFIAQSALLAWVFADWLGAVVQNAPLGAAVLVKALPWFMLCLIARPWVELIKDNYLHRLSLRVRSTVRGDLLDALAHLGPARRHFGSDGALSTAVLEQVDALDGYISRYAVQSTIAVLTPLCLIIATFFHSKLAALLLAASVPLVPVFMILVGTAASKKSSEQMQALAQLSGRFLDLLRGMPTLKRLGATDQALDNMESAATDYQKRTMSVLRLAFLSGGVLELFASLAIALVAVYLGLGLLGILPWAKGIIPVDYQSAFFILLLAPEFYAPLRKLGSDYHAKAQAEAAVGEFYPLLQAGGIATHTQQAADANHNKDTDADTHLTPSLTPSSPSMHAPITQAPSVNAKNLTITTADGRIRLKPTNFSLSAAGALALVGESGSGKSSLLQALLGFVNFTGELNINGTAFHRHDMTALREHIGYLPQTAALLPLSIAENLRLARPDATDSKLEEALTQVQLWGLINQLPNGLNTQLGERGQGLSGGQAQRLAIAQLLLRDAKLWLLDEPCAHLDPQTAADIYQLLGRLSQDKTVILVSHDLTDVDWIDAVCQLDEGNDHAQ